MSKPVPRTSAPSPAGVGTFILAVPSPNEPIEMARLSARRAAEQIHDWDLVVGLSQEAWNFTSLARELLATERVRDETPELQATGSLGGKSKRALPVCAAI